MNENPARPAKEDRHFVTALARGMEVLACFRAGDRLLGNQEIAQRCRLPKSTVSRLTYTLTRLGYLNHVEELGKYRLGVATFALSSTMVATSRVTSVAIAGRRYPALLRVSVMHPPRVRGLSPLPKIADADGPMVRRA